MASIAPTIEENDGILPTTVWHVHLLSGSSQWVNQFHLTYRTPMGGNEPDRSSPRRAARDLPHRPTGHRGPVILWNTLIDPASASTRIGFPPSKTPRPRPRPSPWPGKAKLSPPIVIDVRTEMVTRFIQNRVRPPYLVAEAPGSQR